MAQGMGLHRDGSTLGLPIFESEMRRRLWWQIAITDWRSAELTGSGRGWEISPWGVKVPMNLNDNELFPGMTEHPSVHTQPTEMTSCLVRYELSEFLKKLRADFGMTLPGIFLEQGDQMVAEFEQSLEEKFLRHLDMSIPTHLHAAIVGRITVCTMRMM